MKKNIKIILLILYILSPIDLVPEAFVGLLGLSDDLIALILLIKQILKK
ncbi:MULTISPECIES: DUF1232 domain-containing protein [Basfia]|nr:MULTISPECIES: DUF1232 domain-containing protein [Basfia]SCY02272.1 Protein of unknown function [Basfia succiniciproducens]SEQ86014.1 Protein of unknown function [Basfia succiniciproducens]